MINTEKRFGDIDKVIEILRSAQNNRLFISFMFSCYFGEMITKDKPQMT